MTPTIAPSAKIAPVLALLNVRKGNENAPSIRRIFSRFAGFFGGIFCRGELAKKPILCAGMGACLVSVIRFACHVIAGAVIWYELDLEWYADDPTHIVHLYGPWMFSIVYSAIYMIPEIIATTLGAGLLHKALVKVKL